MYKSHGVWPTRAPLEALRLAVWLSQLTSIREG
jgi:hypothetical protein